jgi:hypothetical protein
MEAREENQQRRELRIRIFTYMKIMKLIRITRKLVGKLIVRDLYHQK